MTRASGIAGRELGQEPARGARERVDRLVLVADDADVAPVAQPQLEQPLLHRVRVLVLVHAEPALASADGLGCLRVGLEDLDGLDEQVIEIDPAGACLGPLVAGEDPREQVDRDGRVSRRGRRGTGNGARVRGRRQPAALGPFDLIGEILGRREPIVTGQGTDQRHEQGHLRIEQIGQRRSVMAERPVVAQLAERVRMERPRRDARQTETAQALDHLGCGLLRERDDQHLVRRHDVGRDRVRRAPTDDPRLAGAGPGQDPDGPFRGKDGLALGVVQIVEQPRGFRDGHQASMTATTHLGITMSDAGAAHRSGGAR